MKEDRKDIMTLIEEAVEAGSRQSKACDIIGLSPKTIQRWRQPDNKQDGRIDAPHKPANKLTEAECHLLVATANDPEYANLSPSKIVPKLADKGIYIASESSFYRVLKAENLLKHRQKSKPARQVKKPKALTATAPNHIYSWDITYLPV